MKELSKRNEVEGRWWTINVFMVTFISFSSIKTLQKEILYTYKYSMPFSQTNSERKMLLIPA